MTARNEKIKSFSNMETLT